MFVTIFIFLIFTAATLAAMEIAVWSPQRKARQAAEGRMRELRSAPTARRAGPLLRERRLSNIGMLDVVLSRLRIARQLQEAIDQAGLKHRAGAVLTLSLALAIGTAAFSEIFHLFPIRIVEIILSAGVGWLPLLWVYHARNKRMTLIEQALPESIDLFTRAMRAGHNIHNGLGVMASEAPEPIGGEFKRVVEELSLGSPVDLALHNLGERIPILDMRFFVTGLILQRETGANLVSVLESMAEVIRERLQLRAKLRAHTAQQRFSAGLICGLPVFTLIVFYFLNHDYVATLWTTDLGSKLFTYAIFSELLGMFVIRRISAIKM